MADEEVQEEYARLAPDYDRRWARYVAITTRESLARLRPLPGERVLDVGCGTGVFLQALLQAQPSVEAVGVEPVPAMLAQAGRRLRDSVILVRAWAADLPFPDAAFDAVVCNSAFHYFPDPAAALTEMRRVLAPGGRLLLIDWCADALGTRVMDSMLRLLRAAHYEKVYRSDELCRLLRAAGFAEPRAARFTAGGPWGMMAVEAGNPRQ